jgi:hypothetical protein
MPQEGTFGIVQVTFDIVQGTSAIIQGTFGIVQGTFTIVQAMCDAPPIVPFAHGIQQVKKKREKARTKAPRVTPTGPLGAELPQRQLVD